jgi:single-stranded-DNA-specific exonuclease
MPSLTKRWQVAPRLPPEIDRALYEFPPILRQILYNRGYRSKEAARDFLEAKFPPDTDPSRLAGIPAAVERLKQAIQSGEPIAVYGDYDADGVTSTALLVQALTRLGGRASGYIPHRFDEGYGLNNEALDSLYSEGVKVIITVDCGIRSLEEARHAKQIGLDLIVSDHHQIGKTLPQAVAVINPKQSGDSYPEKDLAGVGLAYKLAAALFEALNPEGFNPLEYLDLVALGTVADLAPLVGENRALVKAGLESIRQPHRQGLFSLMEVAEISPGRVTAGDISFVLGPRLNAAGRLDSALAAYELLITDDVFEAGRLAQQLDVQNRERQQITRQIQAIAEQLAQADDPQSLLLFAAHPDFNPGVVGLAASRLTENFYRPSIVAQQGDPFTRASCRSIPEFHITEALDTCADLLERYGGHAAAAGFTVRTEHLPELIERLKAIAQAQLADRDLRPTLVADAEIRLSELQPEYLKYLDWLQPTGFGNGEAMLVARGLEVKYPRAVGRDNAHLKMNVTDGWITFDAIAFRQGYWFPQIPPKIDILFTFEKNEFNGRESLQLNVKDIKPTGKPD